MHRTICTVTWALTVAAVPAVAAAQSMDHAQRHELGADIAVVYKKATGATGSVVIATPVDLRLGFMTGDKLVIEPRINFLYNSKGATITVGTTTKTVAVYEFIPDVNVVWALQGNKRGVCLTAGAGVDFYHLGTTVSQISANAGIGTRIPYEAGAIRLEAFVRNYFEKKSDGLANQVQVGARMGLSLWH